MVAIDETAEMLERLAEALRALEASAVTLKIDIGKSPDSKTLDWHGSAARLEGNHIGDAPRPDTKPTTGDNS